jgi:cob(I)alamin adenosyltransferase
MDERIAQRRRQVDKDRRLFLIGTVAEIEMALARIACVLGESDEQRNLIRVIEALKKVAKMLNEPGLTAEHIDTLCRAIQRCTSAVYDETIPLLPTQQPGDRKAD